MKAPSQNPLCDLSGPTIGNFKVWPGRHPGGRSCPSHSQTCNFLEGVAVKDSDIGATVWRLPHGGLCWGTFLPPDSVTSHCWPSPFSSASASQIHKMQEPFVQGSVPLRGFPPLGLHVTGFPWPAISQTGDIYLALVFPAISQARLLENVGKPWVG